MPGKLDGSKSIASGTITTTQFATGLSDSIAAGGGPKIKSLIYPGDDTAANTVGGQTIYINGSGFDSNVAVYVNNASVPSVTYISASNVGFTTPALSAATYPLYVTNPDDGATAILVPGLQISGEPTWVTGATLTTQDAAAAWSISLSATGDTPLTYALAAGSSLPSGISLASNGVISGTMSSPPASETTYNFTVDVSDAQNQSSSRAFSVTVTTGEGVLFANNVLLIHADGTNNGNNHSFLDSSNNNFTITRNGNATQGTFSPFSQTGWSAYFDGTGDYLTVADNAALRMGSGDFTIEFWMQPTSTGVATVFGKGFTDSGAILMQTLSTSGRIELWVNGSLVITESSGTYSPNNWYHIAVVRSGTSLVLYRNGVSTGSVTNSVNLNSTASLGIGGDPTNLGYTFTGYISNFRMVKGSAVYTSAFTPPTAALTAISNTSLLTLQSNRFIDNSTNAFTITRNGDVSIQAWSPFAPTAAYSTANVGGSGYFDGSGDYLTAASNAAFDVSASAYTFEMWVYFTTAPSVTIMFGLNGSGTTGYANLLYSGGTLYWQQRGTSTNETTYTWAPTRGQWYHIAIGWNGSNSLAIWINGTRVATNTVSPTSAGQNGINFGAASDGYAVGGYLTNFRLVKGTDVYGVGNASITVPTAPLTNIANTSLLCNFTNAQIFDQTAKNVLECVGGAKVSTAQYKYGTGSIFISSISESVKMPGVDLQGDFTIEGWVKPSIAGGEDFFIVQGVNETNGFLIGLTTSEIRWRSNGQTDISAAISKADWYHFAISRSGSGSNNVKVFVDGTQVTQGTYTNTILASAGNLNIGPGGLLSATFASYGYIDDLRITKGYARYTANFTAPTAQFKDK